MYETVGEAIVGSEVESSPGLNWCGRRCLEVRERQGRGCTPKSLGLLDLGSFWGVRRNSEKRTWGNWTARNQRRVF